MPCIVNGSTIILSGDVGDMGWYWDEADAGFTAGDVIAALAQIGECIDVTVRLNSGGGIATEGSARDGAEPVHMSWDAAQAALASGAYAPVPLDGERDTDLPAAQSPAPGTDPKDGKEAAVEGHVLTNMTAVTTTDVVSDGLPKSPPPPQPAPAKASAAAPVPPAPQTAAAKSA